MEQLDTLDDLASELSVSKATVSRRLEAMTNAGTLFIRSVVDLASLGFPVESLISITCAQSGTAGQLSIWQVCRSHGDWPICREGTAWPPSSHPFTPRSSGEAP